MIRKHILTLSLLICSAAASAAQVCTIDPPRPAGSTGTGFYVVGGKLLNANGDEFRIRGANRNHWDSSGSRQGLLASGANTERIFLPLATKPLDPAHSGPAYSWNVVKADILDMGLLPIPTNWTTTCSADPAKLATAVDTWVAQAATWTQLNARGLINVANEWGPNAASGPVWRDNYLLAIARMRSAKYTMPLVIDAGYCGQDAATIVKWGQQLLDADPEHNLLFSVHVYGSWHYPATASWMQDYATAMRQLKATGLPIIVGEFGPEPYTDADGKLHYTGPSPTLVPTAKLIADAEANGWGWMPWSWDDNNASACLSTDLGGFGLTRDCGKYTGNDATELTAWGRTIVPLLKALNAKH